MVDRKRKGENKGNKVNNGWWTGRGKGEIRKSLVLVMVMVVVVVVVVGSVMKWVVAVVVFRYRILVFKKL